VGEGGKEGRDRKGGKKHRGNFPTVRGAKENHAENSQRKKPMSLFCKEPGHQTMAASGSRKKEGQSVSLLHSKNLTGPNGSPSRKLCTKMRGAKEQATPARSESTVPESKECSRGRSSAFQCEGRRSITTTCMRTCKNEGLHRRKKKG